MCRVTNLLHVIADEGQGPTDDASIVSEKKTADTSDYGKVSKILREILRPKRSADAGVADGPGFESTPREL
eukprot:1179455-Prorocentrum_minimum.AAC.4